MTIKEFFRVVPLYRGIQAKVIGNGDFEGCNLRGGNCYIVYKQLIPELSKDYELVSVDVVDGWLHLEVDCR